MKQLVIRVLQGGSSFVHMFSIHLFIQQVFSEDLLRVSWVLGAGKQTVKKDTSPALAGLPFHGRDRHSANQHRYILTACRSTLLPLATQCHPFLRSPPVLSRGCWPLLRAEGIKLSCSGFLIPGPVQLKSQTRPGLEKNV